MLDLCQVIKIIHNRNQFKMQKLIYSFFILVSTFTLLSAQNPEKENEFTIGFGLIQPLALQGFNYEIDYWTPKMVIDYSHGINLHIDGSEMGEEIKNQNIDFKVTNSLGFGFGYRFTKNFNLRLEPKMHTYQTFYKGKEQVADNSIANFTTYTLGLGAYYRWLPFERKENWARGITIVPNMRYWGKIATNLPDGTVSYHNEITDQVESFEAPNIGIGNSPFIINITIGYTF